MIFIYIRERKNHEREKEILEGFSRPDIRHDVRHERGERGRECERKTRGECWREGAIEMSEFRCRYE